MNVEGADLTRLFAALVISTLRFGPALSMCPATNDSMISGTARRCVMLAFSILALPAVTAGMPREFFVPTLAVVAVKETLIGAVIGFFASIPFWVAENIGNFIDNQRGATMGEVYSPLSGSQESPTAVFFTQTVASIFYVSGAVFLFLAAVYKSYEVWPVFGGFFRFSPDAPVQLLGTLGGMLKTTVVISAPVIIVMFLATLGLGFVNRTAPQLNVFFLSMPIKSGMAVAMLIIYLPFIIDKLMYTSDGEILKPALKLMGGG